MPIGYSIFEKLDELKSRNEQKGKEKIKKVESLEWKAAAWGGAHALSFLNLAASPFTSIFFYNFFAVRGYTPAIAEKYGFIGASINFFASVVVVSISNYLSSHYTEEFLKEMKNEKTK